MECRDDGCARPSLLLARGIAPDGAVWITPALARALDAAPAATTDLLGDVAAGDPSLRGAVYTLAWQLAQRWPGSPAGACRCLWVLEATAPDPLLEASEVAAVGCNGDAQLELERRVSFVLRQRCFTEASPRGEIFAGLPRFFLSPCTGCAGAEEVGYEATLRWQATAHREGASAARADWSGELTAALPAPALLAPLGSLAAGAPLSAREELDWGRWSGASPGGLALHTRVRAAGTASGDLVFFGASLVFLLEATGTSTCAEPLHAHPAILESPRYPFARANGPSDCFENPGTLNILLGPEPPP